MSSLRGWSPPCKPITALQTLYARHSLSQPPLQLEVLIGAKPNQRVYREGWWAGALIKKPHPVLWSLFLPCNTDQFSSVQNILKEMGIPDHLTCLLRNLYAGQEATVRTGHGTTDWFQIGKRVRQGCMLLPCLFNSYAEYIMRNAGLDEAQTGIRIAGRNINNLRYADGTTLMAEKWRGTKEPLDEGERGECKSWLETQHSKKRRLWHLVPSLHGKSMGKQWQTLFWGAPKSLQMVTAAMKLKDACSLEGKL